MSTEEDRSLGAGMSLPMWMKSRSRLHNRLDFDQSTFSPPENDDNFLYIRYPKITGSETINNANTITITTSRIKPDDRNIAAKLNISKHTTPCKDYILGNADLPKLQTINLTGKVKSAGTDDGFKGVGAACGSSVIRVASQMVCGKTVRGFNSFEEEEERKHMRTIGFDPTLRRGSRSLPTSPVASPNSSPKSKRKVTGNNKYFTGAYADDKKPGSILANLLSKRDKNLSRSVTSISEEEIQQISIQTKNIQFVKDIEETQQKPKPSHLREMNFWSPTSM